MSINRDQILARRSVKPALEPVDEPELGGTVHVRMMTGSQRDRFEALHTANPGANPRARLAAFTLCDEEGKPLFTEADVPALGELPSSAFDRIFPAAVRINGLGPKEIEDLGKNS